MDKLTIKNLCKHYQNFDIDNVSLSIPSGSVVGLIGENGAGKSTIIKSILGITKIDGGEIAFNGTDIRNLSKEEKQKIAFVLDDSGLPQNLDLKTMNKMFSSIYSTWNVNLFNEYVQKFNLPNDKEHSKFSKGMKMKVALAVAFSHESELLILDEPTSGLDPVVRDEILELLYDYCKDDKAIIISSHITSDLEKICDYVIYVHNGKVVMSEQKDELLQKYAIYQLDKKQLLELQPQAVSRVLKKEFGMEALALKERMPKDFDYRPIVLDDIMLFYSKGEKLC